MTEVYWHEQRASDVPAGDAWLSPVELAYLGETVTPKRRADWRLGRWTAKCCAASYFGFPTGDADLERIRIIPSPTGSPRLLHRRDALPVAISLSHSGGAAIAALAPSGAQLGCDVETIERRTPAFESDFFGPAEWYLLARAQSLEERDELLTAIWSAKESVLKAVGEGLRLDTRTAIIDLRPNRETAAPWRHLTAMFRGERKYEGWWRTEDGLVRTIVALPSPAMPIAVEDPRSRLTRQTA